MPFDLPVGSVGRIDNFIVHDVFGVMTLVEPADKGGEPLNERWTLFSSETEGKPTEASGFFVNPPSASASSQSSAPIEDIRFFRDEMANMVWAIENATENEAGQPWPGHERDQAKRMKAIAPPPATPSDATDPLRYVIQTEVPEHWIPFLGVPIDPSKRDIALQRSAKLRATPDGTLEPIEPLGRVLRLTAIGDGPYRIPEEEVPRSGT